jgi:cyclopropane-fatty-acyl-phospholipid synthase
MQPFRGLFEELTTQIGISINGSDLCDITVHNDGFYRRALREKNLGLGEAYMDRWWDCGQLDELVCRILKARLDTGLKTGMKYLFHSVPALLFNLQSRRRASCIAERHYDLDNELFLSFLDPYNQYSCAYFDNTDDLARAQQNKLNLICRKIGLQKEDQVLDIGCGWGGFARYAAEQYGCRVTGVNISKEQNRFARDFCKGLPVEIVECDYRDIQGEFDKIVSIGMFEHVGPRNYKDFMKVVSKALRKGGIFLLHTIGANETNRSSSGDPWINKYIFPNGKLPSMAQVCRAAEGLFVVEDWHNLGPHYDRTLMAWYENFQKAWSSLKKRYDERFRRMWEYYLLSCAGAFRARRIQLWQIVFTTYGTPQPACRF